MYNIERTDWGYQLTFGDFIKEPEMQKWVGESTEVLKAAKPGFGVLVDMRTLKPLPPEAQTAMQTGQKLYKTKGMVRSAVILSNKLLTLQFQRIAQETGIYEWERYIDAEATANWYEQGVAWVRDGVDPDKN